jgi:hypothetical protein
MTHGRTKRLAVVAALALACALAAGGVRAAFARQSALTVTVAGKGAVVVRPGGRVCAARCVLHLTTGTAVTLAARPRTGYRFARWGGACSGYARCVVRLTRARTVRAAFAADAPLASWNPHYHCTPTLTTIPFVLGSKESPLHGATEEGGGLQPHLRGAHDQHLLDPPCSIGGTGTFVEIHDVIVAANPERVEDGDVNVNMADPNRPDIANVNMKTIHTEVDDQLIGHKVAPPMPPPKGTHIDIQGFVFWDPAHTDADWHSFSGWEIHSLTAWRPAVKR